MKPSSPSVRTAWVVGVVLGLSLGCRTSPVEPNQVQPQRECETREDCDGGKVCTSDGYCAPCESSGQCRLKEECNAQSLRCVLRAEWGTDCRNNADCAAGQWCAQGLCRTRADVTLCWEAGSAQCPEGARCQVLNGVCEEDLGCVEKADCSVGETCNLGSHHCVPLCTVDTQAQVCQSGEKCRGEACVQCEQSADCAPGLTCDGAGVCTAEARCYSDRDCKVPLVCHVPTGACLSRRPPCTSNEECEDDERCDLSTGRCVPKLCQPDRYEPNDTRAQAFAVSASRYKDLTLCEADVDHYALTLNRGDQLGVRVDADPFAEDAFSTRIQDASGRTLAAGKFLATYVAANTETFDIVIQTTDAYQPYDVTFLLSRGAPCDDDAFEPNDAPAQAVAVNASSQIEGRICPQDQDYFEVAVPPARGLRAFLKDYHSADGLLRLCLLEGATSLGCSDDINEPSVSVPSATAGGKSLRLRVLGAFDRTANSYTLAWELL